MWRYILHSGSFLWYADGAGNTVEENSSVFSLVAFSALTLLGGRKVIRPVKMGDGGGGHWLVQMEWHPASVNLPLHHKVQKFYSGSGSPGWSRKKGRKTVVVWWWFFFFCA